MLLWSLATFFVFQATVGASTAKWNAKLHYIHYTFDSPEAARIRLGNRNLRVWGERLLRSPDDKKTPRPETRNNELSEVDVVDWIKLRQLKDGPLERAFTATDFWSDQARLDKQNRETQTWFAFRCRLLSHAQLLSMLTNGKLTASSRPFGIPTREDRLKYLIRTGCLYRVVHIEKLRDEQLKLMIDAGLDVTLMRHWNEFDGGFIKRLASLANRYVSWQMPDSLHGIDIIMKHPAFIPIGWKLISNYMVHSFVEQRTEKWLWSYTKMLTNTRNDRKMTLSRTLIAVRLIQLQRASKFFVLESKPVFDILQRIISQAARRFGAKAFLIAPGRMSLQLVQRLTAFPPQGQRLFAWENVSTMDKASWITEVLRSITPVFHEDDALFAHLLQLSERIYTNGLGRDTLSYLFSQSLPSSVVPLMPLRMLENIGRKIRSEPIRLRYRLDAELQLIADRTRELEDDTQQEFFKSLMAASLTWIAFLSVRTKIQFQSCLSKSRYSSALKHSSVKEALSTLLSEAEAWYYAQHTINGVEYSRAQIVKLVFDNFVETGILVPSWCSGFVAHPKHVSDVALHRFILGISIQAEEGITVPPEMFDAEAYHHLQRTLIQSDPAIEKWMGALLGKSEPLEIEPMIGNYRDAVEQFTDDIRAANLDSLEDLSSHQLIQELVDPPPVWIKIGGVQTQWPKVVRLVTDLFIQRQILIPSWIPGEFVFRPILPRRYWTFYFSVVHFAIQQDFLVPASLIKYHHLCYPDRERISQWMAAVNDGVVPTEDDLDQFLAKADLNTSLSNIYADSPSPVSLSYFYDLSKYFWESQHSKTA